MSDPYAALRRYREQFEDAEALFDSGDVAGCISAAKRNITDTALPPFYIIRNCILLTAAMDNWDDGNDWRLAAVKPSMYRLNVEYALTSTVAIQESTFRNVLRKATEKNDTDSLAALQDLREELDWLAEQRDQYLQEYRAWMLEQDGEEDDDETDSEADEVELDDSEEETDMEAEGVKLGVLPIRGHQASTALVMGTVPVGEDKEDNKGREEATAGDEEDEEGGAGKMPGGGEQASTGDGGQLPRTAGVDREDERSAGIAAVRFLFDCQSYMPEHMRAQFNQAILTFQELEVAMRSIISTSPTASAATTSSTTASRIKLFEEFKVSMVEWFQHKERSSVTAKELDNTTLAEWQGLNPRIQATFARQDILSFCRELDGKDGFRYHKNGVLTYKP
ncbi:hypothetical protein J4E90_008157 [Alternaria incomplexa]|uniref:uncharacterized protein n=1 Tax=Alternaria incomplexa TaxID=1187928 RepID=UPI00221E40DF|nr:uncharacterized protein J4E90_008157 [Alternaria incomplexa]KAI4909460.1 hypothetical protein J4E90_008157 [Alternaria incomplexa]